VVQKRILTSHLFFFGKGEFFPPPFVHPHKGLSPFFGGGGRTLPLWSGLSLPTSLLPVFWGSSFLEQAELPFLQLHGKGLREGRSKGALSITLQGVPLFRAGWLFPFDGLRAFPEGGPEKKSPPLLRVPLYLQVLFPSGMCF